MISKVMTPAMTKDKILERILEVISSSDAPLQTEEIVSYMKSKYGDDASRTKVMYRLNNLRGEGKIRGKNLPVAGKGVWIWWYAKPMMAVKKS